jgi:hypothetical protein
VWRGWRQPVEDVSGSAPSSVATRGAIASGASGAGSRACATSNSTSIGSAATAAGCRASSITVSPSCPHASSIAADAVAASAMAWHSGRWAWSAAPSSSGLPKSDDKPLTSSSTNGPITWKRGVNACATSTSAATGTEGEA